MEITFRDLATVVHGMIFGALLLLSFTGAWVAVHAITVPVGRWVPSAAQHKMISRYIAVMAVLAWLAVLLGAYMVYPWYRAHPPAGVTDLSGFPQRLLMSRASTTGWHDLGMEWKEHIAWFTPISLTTAAYLVRRYGMHLHALPSARRALLCLIALAFIAAGIAGFFGAMLNKYAPVRGGADIVIMHGGNHGD